MDRDRWRAFDSIQQNPSRAVRTLRNPTFGVKLKVAASRASRGFARSRGGTSVRPERVLFVFPSMPFFLLLLLISKTRASLLSRTCAPSLLAYCGCLYARESLVHAHACPEGRNNAPGPSAPLRAATPTSRTATDTETRPTGQAKLILHRSLTPLLLPLFNARFILGSFDCAATAPAPSPPSPRPLSLAARLNPRSRTDTRIRLSASCPVVSRVRPSIVEFLLAE